MLAEAGARSSDLLSPAGPVRCAHRAPKGATVKHHAEQGGGFTITTAGGHSIYHPPCSRLPPSTIKHGEDHQSGIYGSNGGGNVPFHGGWQVYTKEDVSQSSAAASSPLSSFVGSWTVPDAPAKYTGQTVVLFTGLQNKDWVPPDAGPKGESVGGFQIQHGEGFNRAKPEPHISRFYLSCLLRD
jgi:hypothetical protein